MRLPRQIVTLMTSSSTSLPTGTTAKFRVEPSMSKFDIKEYLNKVYDLPPIVKVNTVNYDGKLKRTQNPRGRALKLKRTPAYKTAYVQFASPLGDLSKQETSVSEASAEGAKQLAE